MKGRNGENVPDTLNAALDEMVKHSFDDGVARTFLSSIFRRCRSLERGLKLFGGCWADERREGVARRSGAGRGKVVREGSDLEAL
jgi:hypothetical protein